MGYSLSNPVPSQSTPYFTNATAEIKAHLCLNFFMHVWNMRAILVTDKLLSLYIFQMVPAPEPFVSMSARWLIHFSFYFLVSAPQPMELWNSKGHHDHFWCLDVQPWLKKEKKERDIDTLCGIWGKASYGFAVGNGSDQNIFSHGWFELFPYSPRLAPLKELLALLNLQQKLSVKYVVKMFPFITGWHFGAWNGPGL